MCYVKHVIIFSMFVKYHLNAVDEDGDHDGGREGNLLLLQS